VAASGGDASRHHAFAEADGPQLSAILPGGRRFLFYSIGADDARDHVGSLDGEEPRFRCRPDTGAVLPVLAWFVRQGALLQALRSSQRDAERRTGADPPPILISQALKLGAAFSTSASGWWRIAQKGRRDGNSWFDRSGKAVGVMGAIDDQNLLDPELSPDGRRVAVARTVEQNTDVWLFDAARTTRFTVDAADDQFPIWSHDGTRIVFSSTRSGSMDLYQKASSGGGDEEVALASPLRKIVNDWSPDGRVLLFHAPLPKGPPDLWAHWLDGDRRTTPFPITSSRRVGSVFARGRWVAQSFDRESEIYVRTFPDRPGVAGVRLRAYQRWSHDGRGLYYRAWRQVDGHESG
jgi:hypothetical protein